MEVWKDIEGYEGLYKISSYGRVKSYKRKQVLIMTPSIVSIGYQTVNLYKNKKHKSYLVHRLVGRAFIKNLDNKPFINHINGIKTDNNYKNLEWCTQSENCKHAYDKLNRKIFLGEEVNGSKLTENEVIMMREMYLNKENIDLKITHRTLARIFNVSPQVIWAALNRKTWKHV